MSKTPANKATPVAVTDASRFCKSTFTLTFAVEVLGIEVWHDCNEGWLDLGPCTQGLKLQYQLYYGQSYDVDILIWPHTAKVWCGTEYGWVRTWQFLERRFLTFSIRHVFPIRVVDMQFFVATITPTVGLAALSGNAKSDRNVEVYLPPLRFGDRRYFAPVLETLEETMERYVRNMLWNMIVVYIPPTYLDGDFGAPHCVEDIRHQDTILYHVQETIMNRALPQEEEEEVELEDDRNTNNKGRNKRDSKTAKEKEKDKKKVEQSKIKFELKLTGDALLAGAGRIVPFETVGDRPPDMGEIIALISSSNLPAEDDLPIIFVNVENLFDAPVEEFKKLRISQLYTRWKLGNEVHDSEPKELKKDNKTIKFNDHHALPLEPERASKVTATFLDNSYEIELRGIRYPPQETRKPNFFGYEKGDRDFSFSFPPAQVNEDLDIIIAVTKIDSRSLSKGMYGFIRGEYPLFPPSVSVVSLAREEICTNDINAIGAPVKPHLVVSAGIILEAQMTLEASIGFVGCKPRRLAPCFSRLFCLIRDSDSIMTILRKIIEINEELAHSSSSSRLDYFLTGFAIDTGDVVVLYLEGPRDGYILRIWEITEDFYPKVKPVFCSSSRYSSRIYPELKMCVVPFVVLKMYVPLGVVLACPPIYARPALPLPTRSAALKIGRLISGKFRTAPCRSEMPTAVELKSFRLELCAPPRPPQVPQAENLKSSADQPKSNFTEQHLEEEYKVSLQSTVNWEVK